MWKLRTIIDTNTIRKVIMVQKLEYPTPGKILKLEFLDELDMSASKLAGIMNVPRNAVTQIVANDRAITPVMALRLSAALGPSPEFWLNLQKNYDMRMAKQDKQIAKELKAIKRVEYAA